MSRFSLLLLLGAMLAVAVPARGASAAEPKALDPGAETARSHTRRGLSFYELGRYSEALAELEAAYEAKAVPALLFNIAQCHRQLNDLDKAARLYRSFLRTDPPPAVARQARDLLETVEGALQRQREAVTSQPLGLHAGPTWAPSKDPAAPGPAGNPAVPPPSPIAAAAPRAPPAAVRAVAPPPAKAHRVWPALTLGGVAAAAFAGGLVESLASKSADTRLAQLHGQGSVDPAQDLSLRHDASSKYSRGRALYAVSAVAAAAGVVLFFVF